MADSEERVRRRRRRSSGSGEIAAEAEVRPQKPGRRRHETLDARLTRVARITLGVVLMIVAVCASFLVGRLTMKLEANSSTDSGEPAVVVEVEPGIRAGSYAKVDKAMEAMAARRFQEALGILGQVAAEDPKLPGLRLQQARIFGMSGQVVEGNAMLEAALQPGSVKVSEAYQLRGQWLMAQKNAEAAERIFAKAAAEDPFNAEAYFEWGEALRTLGRATEGAAKLRHALVRANEHANEIAIRLKLALALVEANDREFLDKELPARLSEPAPTGQYLIAAAARSLQENDWQAAAGYLTRAGAVLQPEFMRWILRDSFFDLYRDKPEISAVLRSQRIK